MPKPTYSPTLYPLDCRKAARRLRSNTVSAIVTDPPYGLKFMGKEWDHGVPGVQFWQTFLRVCKPGAMLLAFGGTRTYHRLACAIEDAGWEIRDCIMWVYGSGFPKSHNISKSLDKAAGAEREVVGRKTGRAATPVQDIRGGSFAGGHGKNSAIDCSAITAPATDAAKLWDGWGTALKPSYEPVILAMKPLDGTFANNAVKHGVAGINVDGCRIPGTPHGGGHHAVTIYGSDGNYIQGPNVPGNPEGRFPANLIHDGSDEVVGLFPKTKSGCLEPHHAPERKSNSPVYGTYGGRKEPPKPFGGDSGSAARFFKQCPYTEEDLALFLLRAKTIIDTVQSNSKRRLPWKIKLANTVDNNLSLPNQVAVSVLSRVVTEASQGARQLSGLQGLSMNVTPKLLRQLCENVIALILSTESGYLRGSWVIGTAKLNGNLAKSVGKSKQINITTTTTSPMILDGSAVVAMLSFTNHNMDRGVKVSEPSRAFYCAKANKSERTCGGDVENKHPTVKPLALMEYLVRLVTPPEGGVVFDPFMGSGSTGVVCRRLGIKFIGCDNDEEAFRTAENRIRLATQDRR